MRIGIDATCLPPALAGAGRYIHGVVRGLAEVDQHNEYFIFVKARDAGQFERLPANMRLVPLPNFSRPLRLLWQHFLAGAHAHRLKIEIWHGMHYTLPAFTRRLTTITTFHDLGVMRFPQFYPLSRQYYFRRALTRSLHTARHIVAVSQATAGDIKTWLVQHQTGGSAPAVSAIPSGVEEKFFEPIPAAEITRLRQAYRLSQPYLLFVGTFEKRKNLRMLLDSFHLFIRREGNYLLALAGLPDNGSAEVRAAIAQLGLQERVRLLGYVPEADLPALYQGAALFALPSHYEGFGFPLLEAMASGVVALAADNSSLRELAAHPMLLCGETPAVWASKMEQLLSNHSLQREMRARGRKRAREFSWKKTAEQLRAIYEEYAPRPAPYSQNGRLPHAAAAPDSLDAAPRAFAPGPLPRAVRQTLAYADLFDYPLTFFEIHHGLLGAAASRAELEQALLELQGSGEICESEGYFYFNGRGAIVAVRRQRARISGALLRKNRHWLRLVQNFPFVRGVALSGAIAFQNCKAGDDIDLFLIVEQGRLWLVYFALAALLKIFRKRRQLCLNCLVDTANLRFGDQDLFVAHQIAFLQPISGVECFRQFFRANAWCRRYLPQADFETGLRAAPEIRRHILIEKILGLSFFNRIENFVHLRYRRRIARLTRHLQPQAVCVAAGQIKLFTNNHRFHVQHRLSARMQELERQSFCLEQNRGQGLVEA